MELTIKSPFIPSFFRQRIYDESDYQKGYLAMTKPVGRLKGNQSYKVKFNNTIVSLIEHKKENNRRNWSINVEKGDVIKTVGFITMTSGAVDTIKQNITNYEVTYNGKNYVKNPWMAFNGQVESSIFNDNDEKIAHLVSSYIKKPKFNKLIKIEDSKKYTDEDIAFFIVSLNTVISL